VTVGALVPRKTHRAGAERRLRALDEIQRYVRDRLATYAPNTQRALKADWTVWHTWCVDPRNHLDGAPRSSFPIAPAVLIEFITAHSPGEVRAADGTRSIDERITHTRVKSARTIERYLSSLRALHRLAGFKDDPTADADVEATRRLVMRGRTRARPKKPFRLAQVEEILALEAKTIREKRDRAMLAVAYSAMLRRSELVALEVHDLAFDADGSGTATVKFSKTDQDAEGHVRYLAPFAVVALDMWLKEAKIVTGSLFRRVLHNGTVGQKALTDHEVARVFKRLAHRVDAGGLGTAGIAGHSTRIGAAHDLVEAGFDVAAIANAGGWKSLMMPNYYTRELRAKQSAMAQLIRRRENEK
jgi:site-specific recombinase XerD